MMLKSIYGEIVGSAKDTDLIIYTMYYWVYMFGLSVLLITGSTVSYIALGSGDTGFIWGFLIVVGLTVAIRQVYNFVYAYMIAGRISEGESVSELAPVHIAGMPGEMLLLVFFTTRFADMVRTSDATLIDMMAVSEFNGGLFALFLAGGIAYVMFHGISVRYGDKYHKILVDRYTKYIFNTGGTSK